MRELSNSARAVLDAARDIHDPREQDRRRLTRAMVAQLGAAAVLSTVPTAAGAATGTLGVVKVLAAVVVAGGMSATVLWQVDPIEGARPQPPPTSIAPSVAP